MFTTITKRDGRVQNFNESKITDAIYKGFSAVGESDRQLAMELTLEVMKKLKLLFPNGFSVENVQDIVETVLIEKGYAKAAKAYILYRQNRSMLRDSKSELMQAVAEILQETNRENANVGNSPSAKVLQISEAASKSYYLKKSIPTIQSNAHSNGDIYIHDLAWYGKTMTCLQIPLDKLLKNGFNNGHGFIRPPKGIKTAAALSAIILQSNQNDMHGGQSFAFFDRDMATYVRLEYERQLKNIQSEFSSLGITASDSQIQTLAENRTQEECYQAMEGFIYNLNTMHSRAGAQVPFSSVNIGTDTSKEGRMVIDCFLRAYERGLGKGETPLFPNICFKLKKGVNFQKGDPNYDLFKLAIRVSCKRLFPSYSFQDSSFNRIYNEDVAYMGCRTRVMANCNGESVTNCRGNLSFTTLNLPRLGLLSEGDLDKFYSLLDSTIDLCIEQLLTRYDVQKNLKMKDFPFLMGQKLYLDSENLKPNDKIEQAIKHGTLSIGFIGLSECLVALIGKHHGESEYAQSLGLSIISHMKDRCDKATEKYKLNFSLLATPAEQLSGKFTKLDVEKFGVIKGVTDKKWYTNSFHIPVEYSISAFSKIEKEGVYHKFCNAGHISYVELNSSPHNNLQAFETLIRAMADADMGYAAINFPVDVCCECGLNAIIDSTCPSCGSSNINRVRRITGYLSTLDRFNDSKLAEVQNRKTHFSVDC